MINLQDISVTLQGNQILKNLNLQINDKEIICILGPNGSGKTTLLKTIAGLLPYEGHLQVDGEEIKDLKRRQMAQKIGLLSQFSSVAFDYTVYETVMMGRYTHLRKGFFSQVNVEDVETIQRCLRITGLTGLQNHSLNLLSGGQKQRVFLAKVLAQDPDVILLDEPNNHLDMKNQLELIVYLKEWVKQSNKTLIGVFHDIPLALTLSQNLIFMKEGMILRAGKFDRIVTRDFLEEVFEVDLASYFQKQHQLFSSIDLL